MGNAAAKEFKETALGEGAQDTATALAESFVTTQEWTLTGKTDFGATPGYSYGVPKEKKIFFSTQAMGSMGRKGSIHDADKKAVAHIRIDHKMKQSVQSLYKTEPVYEGQGAIEEKVGDDSLYLFAKIETSRSGSDIHSTYSVVVGKDNEFKELYKAKRVIGSSFMALVETVGEESAVVAKFTSVKLAPKLTLQVAKGVDLAAVILTGEATAPNGDMVSQLPGATIGL